MSPVPSALATVPVVPALEVSGDLVAVLVALALLVGVPLFVIAALAVTAGYIQHDAERYVDSLADPGDDSSTDPDDEG